MKDSGIDILMITFNRPAYTRLALDRLLETCNTDMRVWLWQNGSDPETLALVRNFSKHPRVHRFRHSEENKKLTEPTNWLWSQSTGDYLCKVDDDCLMPHGWAQTLRKAHEDEPRFGILGCWRFPDKDFRPEIADKKILTYDGGHRIMQNCWIEGSGYLMKRTCLEAQGLLQSNETFTNYGVRLARKGWVHGWYYPFLYQEHMDDPESAHTLLKTDGDMAKYMPLTAASFAVNSVSAWSQALREEAAYLQRASIDPRQYLGWRRKVRSLFKKLGLTLDQLPF